MEIQSLFIKANSKAGFLTQLQAGNIKNNQIAFILDTKEIWTQGTYFPCPYSKDEIDALITAAGASLTAEVNRATTAEAGLQAQIDSITGEGAGSIDDRIKAAIDAVVDGAPEAFDTLKEIATWINDDQSGAAKMASDIANKVDKVSGKGLSTNDYTDDEKTKLAGIASGAQVNVKSDWNATSGDAQILNKPTIPTVNNGTLIIQKEGTTVDTFTANSSVDKTVNIVETDPTVPAWAKAASKPTYTKSEVGLGNVDNTSDADKPVSTAQKTAIDAAKKAGDDAQSAIDAHKADKANPHEVTKSQVGLSNVTNDKQVKGLASGTTEGNVVVFGADGYTIKDSGNILGWATL